MKKTLKTVKKISALFMAVLLLFAATVVQSSAVSLSSGMNELRAQFSRDAGPTVNGYSIDYSFFSPVKNSADTTRYPLIIFMAGYTEGEYPGKELTSNQLPAWSSSELQARFVNAGGAYIIFARAPEERGYCWNASHLISPLKAAIDDFLVKHPNVDKQRVYVGGWCLGAIGAANLVSTYPDSFAGLLYMSSPDSISSAQAAKLSNTAVWILHCKKDTFAPYGLYATPSWNRIKENTKDLSKVRLTTFATAPDCNALLPNHNVWRMVAYDMASDHEAYTTMETVDGNGNKIEAKNAFISWLSSQYNITHDNCVCDCHSDNFITRFVWSLKSFFWKLFGNTSKRACACGELHW